ncbi:MAG: hypothetical protein L6Q35_14035 [Phycisphaerales bacterium]|nr:hypothetical protein [Phycisphaerales bacterium]
MEQHRRPSGRLIGTACVLAGAAGLAVAGSTAENAVVIIDPAYADGLYIANHYINQRNIPESNILYMDSAAAANYQQWTTVQQQAFRAFLDQRGISDHADIVIVAPTDAFWVSEGGLVSDTCFDITRFSLGTLYTMTFISDEILAGPTTQAKGNRFASSTEAAVGFDSDITYLNGVASTNVNARRYYIGTGLAWTGERGNLVSQVISSLNSSIAADGTRPSGTFYFMNNTADSARNIRASGYSAARNSIISRGGLAEIIVGDLPYGKTDCLGIMTGVAGFSLFGTNTIIKGGAYCDHLTSYAAAYDVAGQTKTTEWITWNAGGSSGAIEEPCNYPGKFPRPMMHAHYFQGLSMAEAWFRAIQYIPFQLHFVGDPLARPFAHIPQVSVLDAPTGTVSGTLTLTPVATTTQPGASIAGYELLVGGVAVDFSTPADPVLSVNTAGLADGVHDVRVLAYDSTAVKSYGRWIGSVTVDNFGRSTSLSVVLASGNLASRFDFNVAGNGHGVKEIRLLHNGRVVGATSNSSGTIGVHGQILGAGTSTLRAETEYLDGRVSRSAPVQVTVASSGTPANVAPVAYGYRKMLLTKEAHVVELPATYDSALTGPGYTYTVLSGPTMSTLVGTYGGAYRIYKPNPDAEGQEDITFRVTTPGGASNIATITLVYSRCPTDIDGSGFVDGDDFDAFVLLFEAGDPAADFDGTGFVDTDDYDAFVTAFEAGC